MSEKKDSILGPDGRIKPELVPGIIAEGIELGYKREYEQARWFLPDDAKTPEWEALTDEQREKCREAIRQNRREMQALGEAISRGEIPTGLTFDKG